MKTSYYGSRELKAHRAAGTVFAVRTSRGSPRWMKTDGTAPSLFPPPEVMNGELDREPARRRYVRHLDANRAEIQGELKALSQAAGKRELVLLCFESLKEPAQYCHRRWFAAWWKRLTGEVIEELAPAPEEPSRQARLL